MKKKFITALSILSILCCLGGVACKDDDKDTSSSSSSGSTVVTDQTVISDFEEYEPDLSLIKIFNTFGKITWNENEAFAKSGVGSAKIQAMGQFGGASPAFYIPLTSALYEYNYANVTKYASYGADFYNAEDTDVNLRMGLVFSKDFTMRTEAKSYVLKSGWNRVDFSTLQYPYLFTKPTITSLDYDITECTGVYFEFDNVCTENYDINDAPVLYMDNFSCKPLSANQLSITFEETGKLFYNANEEIEIPAYAFTDQAGNTVTPTVQSALTKDGAEVALTNNAFTPTVGGTYILNLTATYNGETTEYTYDFVVRNAAKPNELESFDSKYSLANITGNAPNQSFEYVDDMSATNDGSGCVRVINQNAWGWPGAKITVRQDIDHTQYDYVSFKLYIEGENMQKYIDKGDGKKYRRIALWNETVIREVPTDEWIEIVVDVDYWYAQVTRSDPELKNNLTSNSAGMTVMYMFDDLESGFGENFRVSYLLDEYMMHKREFAANELEACGSVVSSSSFSGSYSAFTHSAEVSHTEDGSGSVCVTENGPWPNINLKVSKTNEEILAYDYVTFWVYIDAPGGLTDGKRELALYGQTLGQQWTKNKTWTMFAVPTADFVSKVSNGVYNQLIVLMNDGHHYAAGTKLYIDEIMLTNKTYAANELDNCANSLSLPNFTGDGNWGSIGYSTEMSHTNDGSGSIVRSSVNGWAHTYLKVSKTVEEIKAYDYVSYWVYLDSDRQPDNIFLYGNSNMPYSVATGKWVEVVRPASEFADNIVDGKVDLFWFEAEGRTKSPITVYIDEIMLKNASV